MINKKLFIESIAALQKQFEIDRKCSDAFKVILPDDFVTKYDNNNLINQMIKVLQDSAKDKETWIEYFVFELDFGKKYQHGKIVDKDKKFIDLSTPENLYNFLVINQKTKKP